MSTQAQEEMARRHMEEFWNEMDFEGAEAYHAADIVFHEQANPDIKGTEAYNQFVKMYHAAFPDLTFTIQDMLTADDKVVVRWTNKATNAGELMGIPATGKETNITGISIFRFDGGKIAEEWTNWSTLAMLQQMGVIPPMGSEG